MKPVRLPFRHVGSASTPRLGTGAARVDRFRQFIRFRLTADALTGFVIAIDEPSADPTAIRPYVVDVFQIAPAPATPTEPR